MKYKPKMKIINLIFRSISIINVKCKLENSYIRQVNKSYFEHYNRCKFLRLLKTLLE